MNDYAGSTGQPNDYPDVVSLDPDEALGRAADEALALTERRVEVERMQQVNDMALQRLAQVHKIGIAPHEITNVRLQVLVEMLFGDMDDVRRLDYERAVQQRFTKIIGDVESQANRAVLLAPGAPVIQNDPEMLKKIFRPGPNGGRG